MYQDSVEGGGGSSSLHVSENSGAGIKAEPVNHQLETKKSNYVILDLLLGIIIYHTGIRNKGLPQHPKRHSINEESMNIIENVANICMKGKAKLCGD